MHGIFKGLLPPTPAKGRKACRVGGKPQRYKFPVKEEAGNLERDLGIESLRLLLETLNSRNLTLMDDADFDVVDLGEEMEGEGRKGRKDNLVRKRIKL